MPQKYEPIADHDHSHGHGHDHKKEEAPPQPQQTEEERIRRKLYVACLVCGSFMVVELVGGIVAGSLAIITDAAHLMTDLSAFALAIFASLIAAHGATPEFSYGFKRAEVLSALASTLMIWVLTAVLLYEAFLRADQWFKGTAEPVDGRLMFIIAVLGIGVNIALERVLGDSHAHFHSHAHHGHSHGGEDHALVHDRSPSHDHHKHSHDHGHDHDHDHGHDHGHGHDHHDHDVEHGEPDEHAGHGHGGSGNVNLDAAYLHVLGDLVQSIGVALAGLVIWWKPHWQIIDPICTFLFGILVMYTTMSMLWRNIQVLLEGVPDEIDVARLRRDLENLKGDQGEPLVTDVHDLHVWGLTSGTVILTAHMHATNQSLALKKAHALCVKRGINHVTIQMQAADEECVSEVCCE